jgi:Family of unknown function (DUF5999)
MHPDMLRQLAAGHIRDLVTETGDARRPHQARRARRHRPPAYLRRSTPLYAQERESRLGPRTPVGLGRGRPGGKLPAVNAVKAAGAMTDQKVPPGTARPAGKPACRHRPRCPDALAPDRNAARAVASHPGQGWSLLCNGVVLFDDGGALLPDGRAVTPALACTVVTAA